MIDDSIHEALESYLDLAGDYYQAKHEEKARAALAALSAIDPEAIRREFWNELHAEAEIHYDRRLKLLGPIETLDDAAFRKTLGDGWSAWMLAKKIIDNRHSAILSVEPAKDDGKPEPGDLVISASSQAVQWNGLPDPWYWTSEDEIAMQDETIVVIRRAAEIKRKIEEAKE